MNDCLYDPSELTPHERPFRTNFDRLQLEFGRGNVIVVKPDFGRDIAARVVSPSRDSQALVRFLRGSRPIKPKLDGTTMDQIRDHLDRGTGTLQLPRF